MRLNIMAKLINVYKGMTLTPEQEREMFVQSFQYILDKIDPFIQSDLFMKNFDSEPNLMVGVNRAADRLYQMAGYIEKGFWD